MKNKLALKIAFIPLIYTALSALITYAVYIITSEIIDFLYEYTTLQLINYLMAFRYRYPVRFEYIASAYVVITFIVIYLLFMKKSSKKLAALIDGVEEMASGNLDFQLKEKGEDTIGRLAANINKIIRDLKNITLEEKRAQKTKSDLITNISHDLKTPLTSIMGYLSLIDEDKYKDEVQLRYYVNIAYEKSKSLRVLIDDLFELTKMQNSAMPLERAKLDLVELLGQVVSYLQYQVDRNQMEVRTFFTEDKLFVEGDANKLVRAIENIITNAIKYGRDGHYIDITAKAVESQGIIEIISYGEEISSMDIPFIFDRFYRIEKSRNRESGGSGLGLAITKSIVELHGGTIEAFSSEGRTSFKITLNLIT